METLVAIFIDGFVYASWMFLIASGLTLVVGVMKILNIAHGSIYAFGAYTSAMFIGLWFNSDLPPAASFIIFPVAAVLVGIVVGFVLERGFLKFFYGRDEVVLLLVTFALLLVLEDVIRWIWGAQPLAAYQPYGIPGLLQVGDMLFSVYDLMLILLAAVIGICMWIVLDYTKWGRLLRAVMNDREMATAMGINVKRFYTVTFIIGSTLGAFGGAVTAPMISVQLGIGVEIIIMAFVVVVIGGMGSIGGALLGSLMVGLARAASVYFFPEIEIFIIYLLMTLVLIFRPEGLFAQQAVRKI